MTVFSCGIFVALSLLSNVDAAVDRLVVDGSEVPSQEDEMVLSWKT